MQKLIFGCGYLGCRVAELWRQQGDDVSVVTRNEDRAEAFAQQGYQSIVADVTRPDSLKNLPIADTVLFAVGYDRSSGASISIVYAEGVKNVLAAMPRGSGNFIYISTTGVYGSAGGDWVDETTSPAPQREGGRASLTAEQMLASHPLGKSSVALRLAGIYGPGRIPYIDRLRASEPIAAPSDGWLNLVHVDDGASIVLSIEQWLARTTADGPHLFCVSDGNPVVRANYYREVARLIGADPPTFTSPDPTSPAAERARVSRRISNEKLLKTAKVKFKFPTYREGLQSILSEVSPADPTSAETGPQ